MNPSFGVNWGEWILSIVGGAIVLIISGVIKLIYQRLEQIEVSLPKRMELYQADQERQRDRLETQLLNIRHEINDHAVQLSAIRSQLDHSK